MYTDDPLISDIEDLDPDSAPRRGRPDGRELLLGCLLLLMTVGWAGWQWWQQDSRERNYRLGQQAEKEYRWTEARSDYSAASGYRDATARIAAVTRLINELQDNFVSARWHAQVGDWAAALRAVQAVHSIDPHYGDIASLESEAGRHVYRDALQGAVAMRPDAQPPGLYYRTADSWVWLDGSDQWSSVRSLLSSGAVIYDVPGENRSGRTTPAPAPSTSLDLRQGAEWLRGRRLIAKALNGDKLRFTSLAFDPAMYDFYIAGDQGVWAVRKGADPAGEQPPRGMNWAQPEKAALRDTISFPVGRELDYQAHGSTVSSTVHLPGADWAVLNADFGRHRLLLADIKEQRGESAAIDLYISDADGDNRRLLYSHEGAVGSTQFSPDGRYLLLSTFSPLGGTRTEKLSLVLLDLQNSAPPLTVSEKIVSSYGPGGSPLPQMRAIFLLKGPLAGMVLVAAWGTERGTLSVLDPASPGSPLMSGEIPGGLAGKAWANEQEDGAGVVVAWQPWLNGFSTKDATLLVAQLAPGKPVLAKTFALDGESEPVSSVIRGDYLICAAYRATQSQDSAEFTMYSLPLSGPGNEQARAMKLYSATTLRGTNPFLSGFAWQLGPKLLSYSDNGQLHARTYDGAIDVPLESDVSSFFNFDWVSPVVLLR